MKQMHHKERERLDRERERAERGREKEKIREMDIKPVIKQEIEDVSIM